MKRIKYNIFAIIGVIALFAAAMTSCSDEPSAENYVSFKGEMMSDWLNKNQDYSEFASIVKKAGLMDQLASYGQYTCFAPNNKAVNEYLAKKGLTLDQLLNDFATCDTIARTHFVSAMYLSSEMADGVLAQQNMNRRPLQITHVHDADSNSIIVVNNAAQVYFTLQDDSVENGVVQPINAVLESSTNTADQQIISNSSVSIYAEALQKTGVYKALLPYKKESYNKDDYDPFYDYKSGAEPEEAATPPDDYLYGFTAFLVPDKVLFEKYPQYFSPSNSMEQNLKGLYDLACSLYDNDEYYSSDVSKEGHKFENLTDSVNPLKRFIQYHILDRNCQGYNLLTVRNDLGVVTAENNPTDWYSTLLPYSLMKVEHLTATKWQGQGIENDRYINRCYNDEYQIEGIHIQPEVSDLPYGETNMAVNGIYFYIDDVLVFDRQSDVFNARMRMDFSTIFPELMSNNMRMNGDYTVAQEANDHTNKYGRNYYFPDGYLEGVTVGGNGKFIYRRPRQGYWSMHGDEFICQGNYDVSFRLPPVPYETDWQIRLGYAAMPGRRGVCQVYFDDVPQGIPLDMNKTIAEVLGDGTTYSSLSEAKKIERRKTLKNNGYYYGAYGSYHGTDKNARFSDVCQTGGATQRIVLCTVHIKPGEDHYLRVRAVSSKQGNDNEGMFDYLELVPKSVYGINDDAAMEDDL